MDNVNIAPRSDTLEREPPPPLKPIPDSAKLGSSIPLAMTLQRAYKYQLEHPVKAKLLKPGETPVYEEMALAPSNLEPSASDGMIASEARSGHAVAVEATYRRFAERTAAAMPLYEDAMKVALPSMTPRERAEAYKARAREAGIHIPSHEITRSQVPTGQPIFSNPEAARGSQGQLRPTRCDEPAGPRPIYIKKVES
jgi:hypothetical protein